MKTPARLLTAGVTGIALFAVGAYAIAQPGPAIGGGFGPGMMHGMARGMMGGHGPMMGPMRGVLTDPGAKLETIKLEIGIRPEQTTAWDAFAKVVVEAAAQQRKHFEQIGPDKARTMQQTERQAHASAMQVQRQAAQQKVRAAAETLLAQLDDTQKAKAQRVLPGIPGAGPGMRHGMIGGPGMGSGVRAPHQH